MVIIDQEFLEEQTALIPFDNRGTFYGDAVFDTLRCYKGKVLLFEEHYFRLMSSMRILRMEIPPFFTPELFSSSIEELIEKNGLNSKHARVRITVWRKSGGLYTPTNLSVHYSISCSSLDGSFKNNPKKELELFKDHLVNVSLLNTLKTTNKVINILAGIYASENDYDDLLLLNQNKMVIEAISGNVFLRNGDVIKTPPLEDGCLNGIMRAHVIKQFKKMLNYKIVEETITPFELQRADEIFVTNMVKGVQSVLKYRKKEFETTTADELVEILNDTFFD
jgi:branched-chain amino acid aminotransferase